MIQPNKDKAKSYDDNFLDHVANSDLYKNWSTNKKNTRLATTNAFDTEQHRVNFNSSNQDELTEGVNPFLNQFVDLQSEDPYNELRASNQSGSEQLLKGVGRATTKALTEIAKLPGVVGGIITAPFAEEGEGYDTAFNNSWIKALDQVQEKINTDLFPVYTAKAVKEGNLWDNISSTSFWATDGADGLGFIIAMMAPGAAFEYAGLGSKLIQGLSKTSKYAGMVEKTEAGVNTLKYMGITGKNIDSGLAVMGNTIFEAGAEAKSVGDNLDGKKDDFIQKETLKILSNLDNQRRLGQISIEQYNELSQNASLKAEENFKEQRALAMRDTFVSNVGILLGPNAIMHKAIWGKAGKTFVKETEDSLLKRTGKFLTRLGKAFSSEGFFEEGSQSTVENMFVDKAMSNQLDKDNNFDIGDFAKEYVNTVSSTDGQKAIFLGGVLGGPMMSYQGRKEDIENRKQTNAVLDGIQSQITHFNDTFDNDIYQKDDKGDYIFKKDSEGNDTTERLINNKKVVEVARALNFTEQQSQLFDEAVQSGNTKVVDELKQQAIFNMILPSIHNGEMGIQALEQKLNEDSKFNEIVERDKTVDEKDKAKSFIKETLETAKYLQKQNEKFQDFSKDVIELKNDKATPEQKQDFLNRLNSSYLNVKHQLRQDEKSLKFLKEKRDNILEELGLEKNLQTEDEILVQNEQKNSLLKEVNDEIRNKELLINKNKKDISDIWQGKIIDKSFNDYIKADNELEKEVSEENIRKTEEISKQIKEATSSKDLEEIKTDNPIQQKEIEVKKQEFAEAEDAVLTEELDNKKAKESLIKNQDLDSLKEMEDTAIDPITGKEGIVMENNENSVVIQTEEGQIIEIKKPKINTENISSNEEVEDVKEENENLSSKSNFSLPSKFNDTFKNFVDFMMKPFNKKGLKTSFKLNTENIGVNSQNAIQIYNEAINGKTLSLEDKNLLFNWLPLIIEIDNNKSWSGYPGGKGDYSNPEPKFTIRKNIVDAISQGISLENINGVVTGQSSPELNCEFKDNKPVKNNVLEIDYIKDIINEGKDLSKLEIYHVNLEGKLIPVSQGADLNPSAKTKELLSTGVGNIYITIKNPLGNDVPLKLNFSRLGEQLTVSLLDIYKHILTHANEELLYTQSLSDLNNEDSQFYNPILYENLKTKLKGAINLLGNKENEITLEQIIETIILEDSGSNSHLKIVEDEQGQYALEFKEGNRYYLQDLNDSETLSVLTKDIAENKYRNIITIPNEVNKTKLSFKNEEYLKYLFETKALTTNVSTTSYSFKQEEATIWLEPGVTITKQTKSKPEQVNAFGTNPNFKSTETVVDPHTGERYEVTESLEDLKKQLETEVSNRDDTPITKLKAVFEVRIKEIEEKIRNIQKNSVSLSKDLIMEIEKEGTKENKEVKKAKVENTTDKNTLYLERENLKKEVSLMKEKEMSDEESKLYKDKLAKIRKLNPQLMGFKPNIENTLSKAEQIKEIEKMTQLNNILLINPNVDQKIKDKFEELKNKYSEEFNKLPKKCN